MVIDFHTHVFPDKIAKKAIGALSKNGGIPPYSDGTVFGLVKKATEAGVDIAVTLPVLTSPEQFESVLGFAKAINEADYGKGARLISFAGIHPRCEDIEGKMRRIKNEGFLGVKIHPDYQGAYIDDEGYVKILEGARELDLIVVSHSGEDPAFLPNIRCTPERALKLMKRVPGVKLVLAHMGANMMYDEVLCTLAGLDVYFDTAYVLPLMDEDGFKEILNKHGEDKILFATDSPWSDIGESLDKLRSFGLGKEQEEKILYENAARLLKL
jgi:predicted TIM-barrel fold metal-dependent hydrolase